MVPKGVIEVRLQNLSMARPRFITIPESYAFKTLQNPPKAHHTHDARSVGHVTSTRLEISSGAVSETTLPCTAHLLFYSVRQIRSNPSLDGRSLQLGVGGKPNLGSVLAQICVCRPGPRPEFPRLQTENVVSLQSHYKVTTNRHRPKRSLTTNTMVVSIQTET